MDATWESSRRKAGDSAWVYTAVKLFANDDEMNRALQGEEGKKLSFRVEAERRFLWFTTEYTYRETVFCFNPFHGVPLSEYISTAELDLFVRHEMEKKPYPSRGDSLALDDASDRYEEWNQRNMFEPFFTLFLEGVSAINDPGLPPSRVVSLKDTLYRRSVPFFGSGNIDTLETIFTNVLRTPLVRKAFAAKAEEFTHFQQKLQFHETVLRIPYKSSAVMPGLITETNAPTIEGNTVTWSNFMGYCSLRDYTMWARSRVVNWWAAVITGVVLLLLAGWLVAALVRHRRMS